MVLQKGLADVTLVDVVDGLPQGKALDLMQAGPIVVHNTKIVGSNDFAAIKDSQIIIVTAGLARKPGMSRDDLLQKNAEITRSVCANIKKYAPDSTVITVTNPLDTMAYLTYKTLGFPSKRVVGMAPLLDLARMATFIAMELNCPVTEVKAMVLGTHGDLMVPVPSQTTVSGKPIEALLSKEKIQAIVERTQNGGAEIVALLKTGSAYYAPAASAAHMAEAILKDTKEVIPSSVLAQGEYGLTDLYIGLPAKLGKNGVEEIVEIPLTVDERAALEKSAQTIRTNNLLLS